MAEATPGGRTLKTVWATIRSHPKELRWIMLAWALINLGQVGISFGAAWVLDGPVAYSDLQSLWVILSGLSLVILAQGFFEWLRGRARYFLDASVLVASEEGLFRRFIRAPFTEASQIPLGDLILGVGGVRKAYGLIITELAEAIMDSFSALLQAGSLLVLSPTVAMIAFGAFITAIAVGGVLGHRVARAQGGAAEAEANADLAMADLLGGVATLKASGLEAQAQRSWARQFRGWLEKVSRVERIELWRTLSVRLILGGYTVSALVVGMAQAAQGGSSLGGVVASLILGNSMVLAGGRLARARMRFEGEKAQMRYSDRLLAMEEVAPEQLAPTPGQEGCVTAENVWFRYSPNSPWVVRGLNLRVPAGQLAQIEGASGAGKSTTLRLLAGLLHPERGSILVGGRAPDSARSDLLYLPQFAHLLSGSIRSNLALYSGDAEWDRIEEAAESTGFSEVVRALPMGFDTRLAEGGRNLSGGQRQLLLLTACLATSRPVLLLDEAMAGLDWLRRLQVAGAPLLSGKTILYASHDGAPIRG